MALQVEWTESGLQDFYAIILYLQDHWSDEIADIFIRNTEARLAVLAEQPLLGKKSVLKPEVRSIMLTKHNRLYYLVERNKLLVLNIFDIRQDPTKNQSR